MPCEVLEIPLKPKIPLTIEIPRNIKIQSNIAITSFIRLITVNQGYYYDHSNDISNIPLFSQYLSLLNEKTYHGNLVEQLSI